MKGERKRERSVKRYLQKLPRREVSFTPSHPCLKG